MTGALLLLATAAWAQEPSNASFNCGPGTVLPSAQRDLVRRAATDNTNLYGAVGTAERIVLPTMHAHEGMNMLLFESHTLAGALHVPAMAAGDCEDSVLRAPVDLTSSTFSLASSGEDFGVFYAASVTAAIPLGSGTSRGVVNTATALSAVYYGLAAPFFPAGSKEYDDEAESVTWDWIAGAEFTPGTMAISAGYVGSRGVYFRASEEKSGAFFGAAANQSFAQLPYLRGGVERLKVKKLEDRIGRSSVFGRKLVLPGALGAEEATEANFWTGHLAQENVMRVVDVWATYAVTPTPFFHELRLGGHTPNFNEIIDRDEDWGVRGTAGFVTMPTRLELDTEGGRRFSGSVEANYRLDARRAFSNIELKVRYNDPEVLALFPYAEDALDVYFLLSGGQRN